MDVRANKGKILTKAQMNRAIRKQIRRAKMTLAERKLRRKLLRKNTGIMQ